MRKNSTHPKAKSQKTIKNKPRASNLEPRARIIIGLGTCGIAAGALEVKKCLEADLKHKGISAQVGQTGCIGMCFDEVLVEVADGGGRTHTYKNMTADKIPQLIAQHILGGEPVKEWLVDSSARTFLKKQKRIVLRNCGKIDPESIEDYLAQSGYQALQKALSKMSPHQVIAEIKDSGLRGRGGAGFPTGMKWEVTSNAPGEVKHIICNGDEGDPGAFMDRSVLEGDPHSVIEGMIIAGYAVGSHQGYIYVRAEYPLAVKRLKIALEQAKTYEFLGENVLGSGFSFDIKLKEGAGAFVCGEETALIASIEGRRGMPRVRPPFPAVSGLWGKPTNINNVETLANVPWIIKKGAKKFAAIGTDQSKGTKVFALTGKIKMTGLVEVPMGMKLREVIFDIGGGIKDGGEFKAVQIGGPSGGCLPESLLDTPVAYESLVRTGAIMGSGGMVTIDKSTCMVDLAKFFLTFTQRESCGKCVPCRLGTKRMLEMLARITEGEADEDTIDNLAQLAQDVKMSSLCGLGQTAPNPVLTMLKYFRPEYEAHVRDEKCQAGVCTDLLSIIINEKLCTGCGVCTRHCPVGAISGRRKEVYHINEDKCIKCLICIEHCPFDAIYKA